MQIMTIYMNTGHSITFSTTKEPEGIIEMIRSCAGWANYDPSRKETVFIPLNSISYVKMQESKI